MSAQGKILQFSSTWCQHRVEYKTARGKAKRVVARVKAEAIEGLYDQLETVEGQQEIYRIAAARDQSGKDICQIRNVKVQQERS